MDILDFVNLVVQDVWCVLQCIKRHVKEVSIEDDASGFISFSKSHVIKYIRIHLFQQKEVSILNRVHQDSSLFQPVMWSHK